MEYNHYSVLKSELVDALAVKENGIYVDATAGGGGHSSLILSKLKSGHLYAFDQDDYALKRSDEVLSKISSNYTLIKANFKNIKEKLEALGINKIDGIIYDLGVSSFQLDMKERGFSYREDAKLDMRMDQNQKLTALEVVNEYPLAKLIEILYKYGEEPNAKLIANAIVKNRPINTTLELVEVIKKALPMKVLKKKGHPAKLTFQAIRIEVNDELNVLEESLRKTLGMLNSNCSCAVITFQPLEDKIVKHVFKELSTVDLPKNIPLTKDIMPKYKMEVRKPILPTDLELEENHRSHSARLRILTRI